MHSSMSRMKGGGGFGRGAEPETEVAVSTTGGLNAAVPSVFGLPSLEGAKERRIGYPKPSQQPVSLPWELIPCARSRPSKACLSQAGRQATYITLCFLRLTGAHAVEQASSEEVEVVTGLHCLAPDGMEGKLVMGLAVLAWEAAAVSRCGSEMGWGWWPMEEGSTAPTHWAPSRHSGPGTLYQLYPHLNSPDQAAVKGTWSTWILKNGRKGGEEEECA